MMNPRLGLIVMRGSPLTIGHVHMIATAMGECERLCILLGTPNEHEHERTRANMWLSGERAEMIFNVFGYENEIGEIADIGGNSPLEWGNHVLKQAGEVFNRGAPTDYFAGSRTDALWLSAHFRLADGNSAEMETFNRNLHGMPVGRLHIVNRMLIPVSATDVRTSLLTGDESWRKMVPAVNHGLVVDGFEKYLKVSDVQKR